MTSSCAYRQLFTIITAVSVARSSSNDSRSRPRRCVTCCYRRKTGLAGCHGIVSNSHHGTEILLYAPTWQKTPQSEINLFTPQMSLRASCLSSVSSPSSFASSPLSTSSSTSFSPSSARTSSRASSHQQSGAALWEDSGSASFSPCNQQSTS